MNINKLYLDKQIQEEMGHHFEHHGFIQLNEFFDEKCDTIRENLTKELTQQIYIPDVISATQIKLPQDPSNLMFFEYFKSQAFISFIEEITGFSLSPESVVIRLYQHKDYTLLHDSKKKQHDTIQLLFDLSDDFGDDNGGYVTYTTETEEVLYLEPMFNTLTILFTPRELMSYLKYINHKAKDKKIVRVEIELGIVEN